MKRLFVLPLVAAASALIVSCAGLPIPGLPSVPGLSSGGAVGSMVETTDFKKDEILALYQEDDPVKGRYYVARVLTPATAATKNQAEVLYVEGGKKEWSNKVLTSRKADKPDFVIGKVVLYPSGWAAHESISPEAYRFATWQLGSITNIDELFKGIVEVAGEKYYAKYLRFPLN